MAPRPRAFLDTSVIVAAVLSPEGGSRMVLKLGEAGVVALCVGPTVLAELDDIVSRKAPQTRAHLAKLLDAARVAVGPAAPSTLLADTRLAVSHPADAAIVAEALAARAEWLLTHDKRHLLAAAGDVAGLTIGTPGDFLAALREWLGSPPAD